MRYYSSVAAETTLAAPCSAPATTIVVAGTSGYPVSFPFTLCIEPDTMNKELVEVTAATGPSLTVTRGVDGTSAVAHSLGAVVSHDHSARDFRESREHETATVAHGVTGAVVGTTNAQSLTNKDLTAGSNTFPSSLATDAELATAISTEVTNRNTAIGVETTNRIAADAGKANVSHTHAESDVTGLVADLAAKAPVSTTATLTTAQALTHKDLTDATNTFPGTLATDAEVSTAVSTAVTPTAWAAPPNASHFDATWTDVSPGLLYRRHPGGLTSIRCARQYIGVPPITASASGNIGDFRLASFGLNAGDMPVVNVDCLIHAADVTWRGRFTTGGDLEVLSGLPNATILSNDILSVNFTYANAT